MIPKIVHYCWFGRGEKPQQALDCIASWHNHLPDYQFVEWNEDNFDINSNRYVREAYENRKFAFVTDYVRLYAIYTQGGVYMDTDVEVVASFDPFLHHHAFGGFETEGSLLTGMMAAERGSVWAKELLDQYDDRVFVQPDGSFDMTTNATKVTEYMLEHGLVLNNETQDFTDLCTIYSMDYFCAKDHRTGVIHISANTVCIHHYAGLWLPKSFFGGLRHRAKVWLSSHLNERFVSTISDVITLRAFKRK